MARGRERLENWRSWAPAALLCVLIAVVHAVLNRRLASPIAQPDEAGYLGNATQIVRGYGATDDGYSTGYSLLLTPAQIFTHSPYGFYRAALATNALLSALTPALAYLLSRVVFPEARRRVALATAAGAALVPTTFVVTGTAMSENVLAPLSLALALVLAHASKTDGVGWWVTAASFAGLAYWANPRGLLVAAAAAIAVLATRRSRAPVVFAMTAAVAIGGVALNRLVQDSTRVAGVSGRDKGLVPVLTDLGEWPDWIRLVAGRSAYLVITTFGVAFVGSLVCLTWARRGDDTQRIVAVFAFAAVAFTAVLDAAAATGIDFTRLDYVYYGRYLDGVAGPLLVLGFGWLATQRTETRVAERLVLPVIATTFALGAVFVARSYTPRLPTTSANDFNVLGYFGLAQVTAAASTQRVLLIGAVTTLVVLVVAAFRPIIACGLVVVALATGSWIAFDDYLRPGSVSRAEEGVLADHVNRLIDEGLSVPCVATPKSTSFFHRNNYKFLLPEVEFVLIDDEARDDEADNPDAVDRARTCPLWIAAPDSTGLGDLTLISVENNHPVALWVANDAALPAPISGWVDAALTPCDARAIGDYGADLTIADATITVTNRSVSPWIGGNSPYDPSGCAQSFVVDPASGARAPIPRSLLPGESVAFPAATLAGADPATLRIVLADVITITPTPPPG